MIMDEPNTPLSPKSVSSQATESHNPRVPAQKILDDIDQRFGRAKTKADVIHALERCSYLHRIPLPPPNVGLDQAGKDFCRERVLLNDVAFVPDRYDVDRSHAFALTLRMLLNRLSRMGGCFDENLYHDSNNICDLLMQRACRTSAGADSFFAVQKMLCVEGTFVTQKTLVDDPPIHIDVFLSNSKTNPNNDINGFSYHHQQELTLPDTVSSSSSHAEIRRRTQSGSFSNSTTMPFSSPNNENQNIAPSKGNINDETCRQIPSVSAPPALLSFSSTLKESSILTQAVARDNERGNNDDKDRAKSPFQVHPISSSEPPSLCARIQVSNSFAIYDVSAMDLLGETDTDNFFNDDITSYDNDGTTVGPSDYPVESNNDSGVTVGDAVFHKSNSSTNNYEDNSTNIGNSRAPRPWLDVESVVVDESNFKTGRHWRRLHLLITCVPTGQTFSSDHYSSFHNSTSESNSNNQKHRSLSQSHSENNLNQHGRVSNSRAIKALSTNLDDHRDSSGVGQQLCADMDFCSDADDDLFYGPRSRRHADHSTNSGRLSGRRVFRELTAWLSASSAAAAGRLSGGQRSQQSLQTLNTANTQHSSSHVSHTPGQQIFPHNNNDHEVGGYQNLTTSINENGGSNINHEQRRNGIAPIDIAHRGLPSLPFLSNNN